MKYEENIWYGWNGGECPVHPETVVHWVNTEGGSHKTVAGTLRWNDDLAPVAAFRVIKEHKEPREFWLWNGEYYETHEHAMHHYVYDTTLNDRLKGKEIIHVREVTD